MVNEIDSIVDAIVRGEIIPAQYNPHVILRGDDAWSILDKNVENYDQLLNSILFELSKRSTESKEENTIAYSVYPEKFEVHASTKALAEEIGNCVSYLSINHPEYGLNEMFCILFLLFEQ